MSVKRRRRLLAAALSILLIGSAAFAWNHWKPAAALQTEWAKLKIATQRYPAFRIHSVVVRGAAITPTSEVLRALALSDTFTLWTDTDVLRRRVAHLPSVSEVRVDRRLPNILVVSIRERAVVARLGADSSIALTREATRIPPFYPVPRRGSLPVVLTEPEGAARLASALGAWDQLRRSNISWAGSVDTLRLLPDFGYGARLEGGTFEGVEIWLPTDSIPRGALWAEGTIEDFRGRYPERSPAVLDLRRHGQVNVRFAPRVEDSPVLR